GLGVSVKAFTGAAAAAVVGMIEAVTQLGLLSAAARQGLADVARPAVLGGGRPVGAVEPAFELDQSR
ncbi:MAG: hypothetical protein KJN71_07295, partial [Acidimicrobiia bacterium]|nr:hypothetical protein [Acidimicrobiia bacterium]